MKKLCSLRAGGYPKEARRVRDYGYVTMLSLLFLIKDFLCYGRTYSSLELSSSQSKQRRHRIAR